MKLTSTNLFVFGQFARRLDTGDPNAKRGRIDSVDVQHLRRAVAAGLLAQQGQEVVVTPEGREMLKSDDSARRGYEVTSKKAAEHDAGSDGNYMTKQNLWLLQQMAEVLYKNVPHGELLPDWAESKINSAAEHIKSVAGWLMYERSHVGDEMYGRTPDESALRGKLVRLAHSKPHLRPHLLPLLREASTTCRK